MKILHLPFLSSLEAYQTQAEQLLQARNAGDADAHCQKPAMVEYLRAHSAK